MERVQEFVQLSLMSYDAMINSRHELMEQKRELQERVDKMEKLLLDAYHESSEMHSLVYIRKEKIEELFDLTEIEEGTDE